MKRKRTDWPAVLTAFREATGWTQQQCADEIGTSRRHWIRWEVGESEPFGPSLYALTCMVRTHAPAVAEKICE